MIKEIISILKGKSGDDNYFALRFAFWSVVTMLLIGAAVCIGVFIRSI